MYENSPDINYKPTSDNIYFSVSKNVCLDRVQFNKKEWRTLAYILKHIDYKKPLPLEPIYIDKKELAEAIGIYTDYNHRSGLLNRDIGNIVTHSTIDVITKEGNTDQIILFKEAGSINRNQYMVQFNESAAPFFGELKEGNYVKILSYDYDLLNNDRAIQLYNFMMLNTKYEEGKNPHGECILYVSNFTEMFNIPETGNGAYENKSRFNGKNFEKRVIISTLKRIDQNCKQLKLIHNDTKNVLYEEIYKKDLATGFRILGYRIKWELF